MDTGAKRIALVLVNHPNLDILFIPVIRELTARGFEVKTLVCEYGRTERLEAAGVPFSKDLNGLLGQFLTAEGADRIFLNGADLVPVHALGIQIDQLCRKQGIPSLTLEHGPFSVTRNDFKEDVLFEADRMALIGEYDRKMYMQAGVPPERLVVTGCPQYDEYFRQAAGDRHCIGDGYVLIAGQNHSFLGEGQHTFSPHEWTVVLARLFQVLSRAFPGRELVVKPHPAEPFFRCDGMYAAAAETVPGLKFRRVDLQESIAGLVLGSDLVVSFSSSLVLESSILGRRCYYLDSQDWKSRCIRDLERFGAVGVSADPAEFPELLEEILELEGGRIAYKVELDEETLSRFVHRFDGRSAERVADACAELIASPCPLQNDPGVKLHLGCGRIRKHGFVNVDLEETPETDQTWDVMADWPVERESVSRIEACHLVSTMIPGHVTHFLKRCFDALRPGGVLVLEEYDSDRILEEYRQGDMNRRMDLFGDSRQPTRWIWNGGELARMTEQAGLVPTRLDEGTDMRSEAVPCVRMEAVRPYEGMPEMEIRGSRAADRWAGFPGKLDGAGYLEEVWRRVFYGYDLTGGLRLVRTARQDGYDEPYWSVLELWFLIRLGRFDQVASEVATLAKNGDVTAEVATLAALSSTGAGHLDEAARYFEQVKNGDRRMWLPGAMPQRGEGALLAALLFPMMGDQILNRLQPLLAEVELRDRGSSVDRSLMRACLDMVLGRRGAAVDMFRRVSRFPTAGSTPLLIATMMMTQYRDVDRLLLRLLKGENARRNGDREIEAAIHAVQKRQGDQDGSGSETVLAK